MIRTVYILLLSTSLSALPYTANGATYYSYTDDDGTIHFTDERPETKHAVRELSFHESLRSAIKRLSRTQLKNLISTLASEHSVEAPLIEAVVKAESEYDIMAVSRRGARGLMQLMPATAESLGVTKIHDPMDNLRGGVKYLSRLLKKFPDNLDHVLAAYNAGENAVSRFNGVPPFAETVDYVKKVRKYYEKFRQDVTPTLQSSL